MIDLLWILPLMLLLMALKGFFSGSEIAIVSADKIRLRHKASQGDRGAAELLKMEQKPEMHLATTLIGTNVSIVMLTTLGTIVAVRLFGSQGELWAIVLFSPLFLILTEVVPKSLFQQQADRIAPIVIRPLRIVMYTLYPLVASFALFARAMARLAGGNSVHHVFMTREMVRAVLDTANKASDVSSPTWTRLRKTLRLSEVTVGEIMIPMADISAIDLQAEISDAIALACAKGHFRLPVYEHEAHQVVGVLAMDVWQLLDADLSSKSVGELLIAPEYVVPQQPVHELVAVLRSRTDRMAVVVDEYGSAIGMITLEDIQEEVLGEFVGVGYNIRGYVHRSTHGIEKNADDCYEVDGRVALSTINDLLAIRLPVTEAHTIGGFITAQLRHLPKVGESITLEQFRFTVLEATGKFVRRVAIEPV